MMLTRTAPQSLLKNLPETLKEEAFTTLLERPGLRLEQILSLGHQTPDGEWLVGNEDEWVLLLKGSARLYLEGGEEEVSLETGDALLIPRGIRHRVTETAKDQHTVWLALHLAPDALSPHHATLD